MKILEELWTKEEVEAETRNEYQHMLDLRTERKFQKKISETCRIDSTRGVGQKSKSERYYNRTSKLRKQDIGDRVKVLLPLKTNNMQMKWLGPFEVVYKIGELDYRVKINYGRVKTYHINMLKKDVDKNRRETLVEESHELPTMITVVNDGEVGVDEKC